MKKIMFMTNTLYSGGAEKVLQTLLNNLDRSLYDVTVYSLHRQKIDPEIFTKPFNYKVIFDEPAGGIELLRKIKGKIFNTYPPDVFYSLFIKEKYDVEVAFIEGESTKIISGSGNPRSRKIAWVHTDMIKNNWTDFLYDSPDDEAEVYRKFDEIVCVSDPVKDAFETKYSVFNTVVKYNPVDSEDIRKKAGEKTGADFTRPLIVSLGRLEEPKGYARLLSCAAKLRNEGENFTLWIIGDGKQRAQLEKFIEENGHQKCVNLLGFSNNPYKYLNLADAFICSSYVEGFSTAATESIILGKPVYTLDCPGMNELFGGEECGEILPNTDEYLYILLKDAVTDAQKREEFTQGAIRRSEFFDVKKRVADIEDLL
ncbi:MAG: glycosyltransferase [Clostridia bacterium]|nr:glycosyltransferase [Clostridia bacterium]